MKRRLCRPALAAILAGACTMYVVCCTDLAAWKPARRWQLRGRVSDGATNGLAGARISASGTLRWTLLNLFFGTHPPEFHASAVSGVGGTFTINFRAASATLRFEKEGFVDGSIFLTYLGGEPVFYDGESGAPLPLSETNLDVALRRGPGVPLPAPARRSRGGP